MYINQIMEILNKTKSMFAQKNKFFQAIFYNCGSIELLYLFYVMNAQ